MVMSVCMTYSIFSHITYILEARSNRLNNFSLIGRKPNKILQFKWKRIIVLKFKSKLNLKFMLKGIKTIRIMKRSKNRRRLTQVKAIFFAYKQTRNISIIWHSVHPPPFLLGGGVNLLPNFQKGGARQDLNFQWGLLEKRE